MNRLQTPDSDGDTSHPKPSDGSATAIHPPSYAVAAVAPPPYAVTADWLLLVPHYRRYLPVKLTLGVFSIGVAGGVIGLSKALADKALVYKNTNVPLRTNSISYGAAVLAIIWIFFELLVLFGYKYKTGRRGIHPGGHVLFNSTIIGVAIVSAVENTRFIERDEARYYQPETPVTELEMLHRLQRALTATVMTLAGLHFVLLCFACVETSMINSGKHGIAPIPMHRLARPQAATVNAEQPGPSNRQPPAEGQTRGPSRTSV